MLESLQQTDQQLLLFLNSMHAPFWDSFMWLFSGKWIWLPMYATILYVLLKNFNWRVSLVTVIAIALLITYADQMCSSVIRPMVQRLRPSNPDNPISPWVHILHGKRGGSYGFPSCHASNSFALAFFVLLFFKQKGLSIFILSWATLNSYSRIYLGVHYPGDLLAGMLVGLSGALIIYFLYRYALRLPVLARLIKYNENRSLIEHPRQIRQARWIAYIGLLTIGAILLYSAFTY